MALAEPTFDTPADPASTLWLHGIFAPIADELDATDLRVTGSLPAGLLGAFLRNGPNPQFAPLGAYHLFDGDGMVHGLWFDGEGGASYSNRWIRSRGLEAERAAGHALFGGLSSFRLPDPEVMAEVGPLKNTANTALVHHAGRLLALMEACPPTELTMALDTVGELDFDGKLVGPMTAHPKVDPFTGELVFYGASPTDSFVRIHSVDASGALTWSTQVDILGPVMMHDFVITETKVVLFDLPAVFDLPALISGGEAVRWDPDRGTRIGVLERGAPGSEVRWIDTDPFWVFHFLNAHDDGDAVVAYGCRAERLNTSFDGQVIADPPRPRLHRWRIDPAAGTLSEEQLDDHAGDFPRIDDRLAGRPVRYGYLGHSSVGWDEEAPFDSVVKHDLRTGSSTVATYGSHVAAGEPVFAADPGRTGEDDGWILNWVTDRTTMESSVVVLDAATLETAATVHLPRRVPFGFHGAFVPDAAR